MTTSQAQIANRKAQSQYRDVQDYCESANMRLSRDPEDGYWLHYDNRMRFVRMLSDVRGTVDWLNRGN